MTIKNILFTSLVTVFIIGKADNTSQEYSSVEKICNKGKCQLWHTYDKTDGASVYWFTHPHDLEENTLLIIKDNDLNIFTISAKNFQEGHERSDYFPTECSLPEEFNILENEILKKQTEYPKKFYVLEQKDPLKKYAQADCEKYKNLATSHIIANKQK
ncbi:MAG TPA: hypothetical protein VL201_04580 [Patescibacteria group bacterium]|nr:hypothetical protein [Patescibacteria group bacterium]